MSDLVTPGEVDAEIDSTSAGHAMGKAGTGAWIVDGADIAGAYSSLDETVLNAFAYNATASSGLDAVIDPGEAYVSGWLCRDVQTTVTLPASDTVDVYVGYDASAILSSGTAPADNANIIVGLDGDFAAEDPRTHIWTFATDGSSIIDSLDERQLQKPIEFSPTGDLTANADFALGGSLSVTGTATFNDTSTFNAAVSIAANVAMNNNDITDVASVQSGDTDARLNLNVGGSDIALQTGGSGSGAARVHDNSTGEPLARFLEGGGMELHAPSGHLRMIETDTSAEWRQEASGGNLNLFDANNAGHLRLLSGGDVTVVNGSISDNRGTAVVSGSEYEIQVDGSDGAGIINFKTQ